MVRKHVSVGWWDTSFYINRLVAYESDREPRQAVRRYIHVCRVHVIGSSSEYRTRFILYTWTHAHTYTHSSRCAMRARTLHRLPGTLLGWKNALRFERDTPSFRRTHCCHDVCTLRIRATRKNHG